MSPEGPTKIEDQKPTRQGNFGLCRTMKIIGTVLAVAFLIIASVLISLVRSGGALKPAGVIKPAEFGSDPSLIGKQIAVRLYPDFHAAQHVIWRLQGGEEVLAEIARTALVNSRALAKPTLVDLRSGIPENCLEHCWYILAMDRPLPDPVSTKIKDTSVAEIFVQYFDRNEKVPETCETEKILTATCMRPVSVREVRRKIKTSAPHFFMQRYLSSQFFLFIEKSP